MGRRRGEGVGREEGGRGRRRMEGAACLPSMPTQSSLKLLLTCLHGL